ncbi:hypothetical protein ACVIST_006960 [Bradyrhizobium elkanii]
MRRRHARVRRDVVVGVAEIVRHVEDEPGEEDQEAGHAEHVLDRRIRRERNGVFLGLGLDAGRVVLTRDVQRPDVQHDHAGDHERQQVVQREEAVQRRVADRIAAPQQGHDALAEIGHGREQIGDDGGAPEAHLAPWQHVAHEARRHHQEVDDDAEDPQHLARLLVRPVIKAAEHMDVDGEEEHRRAAGMHVAQQPAVIDVADDQLDRLEGEVGVRRVVHRQDHAGQDLQRQHHRQDGAEGPPVVQVARRRIGHERGVDQAEDRKAPFDPLQGGVARLEIRWSAH